MLLPSLHIHIRAPGQELWFLGHCTRAHLWPGDKPPKWLIFSSQASPSTTHGVCLFILTDR